MLIMSIYAIKKQIGLQNKYLLQDKKKELTTNSQSGDMQAQEKRKKPGEVEIP